MFQRKRYVWYEPWFFQQRIRTAKGWMLFLLMLLALGMAVAAALYFAAPANNPMPRLQILVLSVGFAAAVWWLLDGTNTRRQAVLFEDSLVVGGDMGKYSTPTTYKLANIPGAAIVLPEQSKWPQPALFFHYGGEEQAIGIESQTSLTRLARALHAAGVAIQLDGWLPNAGNEFEKAFSWQADPRQVTARAQLETLPPGTPSMMNVGGILLAIVRQCWAIALWLLITAGAIYYGYTQWNNLGLVHFFLLFVVPLGAMYLAGDYTDRFASAATSHGLIRMSKQQLRKREGMPLDLDAEGLLPVEIFARDQFANTVQVMREMGFVQANPRQQGLYFEGKKERWTIPARSILSLAIEEVQTGTPGQSFSGTLNYYVVVRFIADEEREFGFRYADREYGKWDDLKRAEGAVRLFELFELVAIS